MPSATRALSLVVAFVVSSLPTTAVNAQPSVKPLGCALREHVPNLPARALCEELGRALKRPVQLVDDARKDTQGEAVEIMRDDVQWTLVVLKQGAVSAWTRVSVSDAQSREPDVFARALRVLLRTTPKQSETCVRVVPKGERSERAPDVIYPWAELKPCARRSVEVLDPWWK